MTIALRAFLERDSIRERQKMFLVPLTSSLVEQRESRALNDTLGQSFFGWTYFWRGIVSSDHASDALSLALGNWVAFRSLSGNDIIRSSHMKWRYVNKTCACRNHNPVKADLYRLLEGNG